MRGVDYGQSCRGREREDEFVDAGSGVEMRGQEGVGGVAAEVDEAALLGQLGLLFHDVVNDSSFAIPMLRWFSALAMPVRRWECTINESLER